MLHLAHGFDSVVIWYPLGVLPDLQSGINHLTEVSQVSPTRPERAEAPSPGHRPGCLWAQTCRPVRAKAFKYLAIFKAFAPTGRLADCHYTQGDALG